MDSSIHCRKAAALFDVAHMCGASFRVRLDCSQCDEVLIMQLCLTLHCLFGANGKSYAPSKRHLGRYHTLYLQGKDAIQFLETLIVGDVASLEDRTGTLSVFTNEKGGIIDDSVITKASFADFFCIPVHFLCMELCAAWQSCLNLGSFLDPCCILRH